jgi:HEAT repeat protein
MPPVALNDGNSTTVWSSDGDARGQLLTARSSGGFPITGLRLLPGNQNGALDLRAGSRPRKLALIFGKNGSDNLDVELEEDHDGGRKRSAVPFWIQLPKPVASSCVTVVVRETAPQGAPVSIADLDVMTEVDGAEAADRLVASLSAGIACTARQPLLIQLGQSALPKVVTALTKTGPGLGRECLVDALAALLASGCKASTEVLTALAGAVVMATPSEEMVIAKVLPEMEAPPVGFLSATLLDAKAAEADRLRAARVLAAISGDEAARAVLAAVGHGGQSTRRSLREAAAMLRPPVARLAKSELDATPAAETNRRADLLLVLATLAQREPIMHKDAVATLEATLKGQASFEEQARAIAGLGILKDPEGLAQLAELRSRQADGVLRYLATAELATPDADGGVALHALRFALGDADPRVRATAAEALGQRHDRTSAESLIAAAQQEAWTDARRAEVAALGELCTPAGDEVLQRALRRDVDEVREVALAGIAHCYGAKANPALVYILGRLPESADMRSLAARLLAERRDPSTVAGLAAALARLVKEVEGDMSLHTVIAETAMALAAIHTPEAISALATLLSSPSAPSKRAGIDALGVACDAGVGAAALRAAAQDKDETISIPAATAEAHCREVAKALTR